MIIPDDPKRLIKFAQDVTEICRGSQNQRAASYRQYGQWLETGRANGGLALANMLYAHDDRLAGYLFSPVDLRFMIDFENHYGKTTLTQAEVAGRVLSREWERRNIDMVFGAGVKVALDYGASIIKFLVDSQINETTGTREYQNISARLVMPWQFGVYNEAVDTLDRRQEAMVETAWLSRHEVWRRVAGLPDAEKLYTRVLAQGARNEGVSIPTSFMHQVLSTAILDVSLKNATTPSPGGIVQLSNDPSFAVMGPTVEAELFPFHELTVWDDERGDWTTIQWVEPDILIAPRLKRTNLFCPETLCYVKIQPNQVANYFWGRSEIVDLMMPQDFLTATLDDIKRIFGQQVDKLLAFPGYDGLNDELYGQFRSQGFIGMPPNSSVQDLTPQMPTDAMQIVSTILSLMDRVSGFPPILGGEGEPGVRAGTHADTLMKNASPRLRDRALLVERQCAEAGDAVLSALEAKNPQLFWTESGKEEESSFYLSQLPEDRRVAVDSHSTSPIFQDDHQNLLAFGLTHGLVDPVSGIEMLPFPNKDLILIRQAEAAKQKQALVEKLIQVDPADATKQLLGGGAKKHGK